MPAKPAWFLRIPEILELVEQLSAPVIDRATCERLFGVRRRRAISLLQAFGGYRAGNAVLVDRSALIRRLHDLEKSPEFYQEHRRKKRLSEEMERLRRYSRAASVSIQRLPPAGSDSSSWTAPDGVSISEGRLTVAFNETADLLSRLYALAEHIAADYEGFSAVVSGGPPQ